MSGADNVLDLRSVLAPLARCMYGCRFPSPWYHEGRGLGEGGELNPLLEDEGHLFVIIVVSALLLEEIK